LFESLNHAYRRGVTIESALQTRDGAWRVEIVKRGQTHWYRIVHGANAIDWLSIAAVERILAEACIDMADLVDATTTPTRRTAAGTAPRECACQRRHEVGDGMAVC
jgi:bifunctional non-homologous end joining protein LigD